MSSFAGSPDERTWFGHPRGLTVLFLTNMWEQFSYYGMRALLVYYMTKQLLFSQEHSSLVYGAYTACAYFTPIFGGVLADRVLGKRRAILLGGSIMALGHFMMAFEPIFYVALVTIALGNGLFLPSLPSQIDDLYKKGDPRVGSAYNVYYVGINIGGFLAPLTCGTLGEVYGWHYGFGAAGIGMVAGLLIYIFGQPLLPNQNGPRRDDPAVVAEPAMAPPGLPRAGEARTGRDTLMVLAGVALSVTVFRSAYEQLGNTVALWADSGVNRQAGSFEIPMTWFQSLNPLFVMLFTPFLLARWARRSKEGVAERPARRMSVGAGVVGGAYLLLAAIAAAAGGATTGWVWLVLFFAVLTFGELFILPTGLGLFARLAPARFGATTVAAWFVTIFSGSLAAGVIGTLWSRLSPPAYFLMLAGLAGLAALLLRSLDRPLARVMDGQRE